jgi:transglutaminase-like putative cysteine protease
MLYDVRHQTTFSYGQTVSVAQHVLHLMPRESARQRRVAFLLNIDPEPTQQKASRDFFGNDVHYLTLQEPHKKLLVESRSRVDLRAAEHPLDSVQSQPWEQTASALTAAQPEAFEAQQFAFDSPYITGDREVRAFALQSFQPGRPVLDAAMDLTGRIFTEFEYQGGVSDVSTPVRQVLKMRKGVCQDFAHLQIACLRTLGLAVRYVSGYLMTHPPEGQTKLVGADASHAWLSLWAGPAGWVDFDPTNNVVPATEHITVAWGRDYGDVSPINGFIIGGGAHEVRVAVDVVPVV